MQEKLTIARPYAAAAFDFAEQASDIDGWSTMLSALALAVTDPQLAGFIGHPNVSDEQMLDVLESVLGSQLNEPRKNFVVTLLDAERLELAPQIAALFQRRMADAAGSVTVEVTSAFALTASERETIASALKSRLGRECQLEANVDQSLIGGAVIKIGDSVTDLSLRGRLAALEQQLG